MSSPEYEEEHPLSRSLSFCLLVSSSFTQNDRNNEFISQFSIWYSESKGEGKKGKRLEVFVTKNRFLLSMDSRGLDMVCNSCCISESSPVD
ncbi:hypothetical protein VNO77_24437 [Canavalia gladiata]|uniref:Uncharacterized protein n=1 Tax=Canavalia gladiata TaxID=3824 RepID=A0AAN9L9N5_CANGL